ncbi:hypothetical protein ACQP00_29695 [Dactylosporangium sp. CS-047395]|uniref:hypothetical protein n=1 Tax=Dactylosporangium sp. CS-047395 TaxID=3239936 RepID=UPI003D8FE658
MNPADISLRVIAPGLDGEYVERLTRSLRTEIVDLDVDDVTAGPVAMAPAGTKSAETLAIGALVVALAPTVAQSLMAVISSWLSRQPAEIEIEIDGHRITGSFTKEERDGLVAAYLRRIEDKS